MGGEKDIQNEHLSADEGNKRFQRMLAEGWSEAAAWKEITGEDWPK